MRIFILVLATALSACAHQTTVSEKAPKTVAKKTRSRASASTSTERDKQDWAREKALILAKKNQTRSKAFTNPAANRASASTVGSNPQTKRLELNLNNVRETHLSEAQLLHELEDHYDRNDEWGFQSRYQALQSRFPKSARLAEAHYLAGMLAISNKNYGAALKAFDLILKKSPRSPEAPKALFAKAITYKRMNLPEPSRGLLRQVQARYPKSIESQRAALELKIEEQRTR